MARGFLTGKYVRGKIPESLRYRSDQNLAERFFKPEDFDILEAVMKVAKEKSATPSQVALAWLIHKGVVAPIIGATKIQHVEEAVQALSIRLSTEDVHRLEAPYKPHPIMGHN